VGRAIHLAAAGGHTELCKLLLAHRALPGALKYGACCAQ
jgi:hypothetical protein